MEATGSFYEDDEPAEDIVTSFETGKKGLTGQNSHGPTGYLTFGSSVSANVHRLTRSDSPVSDFREKA